MTTEWYTCIAKKLTNELTVEIYIQIILFVHNSPCVLKCCKSEQHFWYVYEVDIAEISSWKSMELVVLPVGCRYSHSQTLRLFVRYLTYIYILADVIQTCDIC
mgnify:FL=1